MNIKRFLDNKLLDRKIKDKPTLLSNIYINLPKGTEIWNVDVIHAIVMGNSVTIPINTRFNEWEFNEENLDIRVKGHIQLGQNKNKFVAWSRWTPMDSFSCEAFEVTKKIIQSNG